MCGIVGIVGKLNACKSTLNVLKNLEYRGYDSAGLAYLQKNHLKTIKALGKLNKLKSKFEVLEEQIKDVSIAIGHTRWATHGKVLLENTHPILSENVAVVHNGIIENHDQIRLELKEKNVVFETSTDTEVIPHLLSISMKKTNNFFDACVSVVKKIEGAYAFAAIHSLKEEIFVARKTSPLVLGLGDGYNIVGSDAQSISHMVNEVIYLNDGDYAILNKTNFQIYDFNNNEVEREKINIKSNLNFLNKDGYKHFMEKEIHEQPNVLINTIGSLVREENDLNIFPEKMNIQKNFGITICAAGTSHYAAMVGKYWIEKFSSIPVNVELSSEYRYRSPASAMYSCMIVISQSGESIDTLMAMREAKRLNLTTTAITNVENSSIDREADYSIFTHVGPEVGVASTKSFTSQLIVLLSIAMKIGMYNKNITSEKYQNFIQNLKLVPNFLSKILSLNEEFINLAQSIKNSQNILYLGRGILYPLALEGALKLKELSYIHSEGFAAGEMKHGPIALIEEGLPIIMFLTSDGMEEKSISNLQEALARGGEVFLISDQKNINKVSFIKNKVLIPSFHDTWNDVFSPIFMSIPAQLIAYHVARERGTDVDQPRNLAKSVTVE